MTLFTRLMQRLMRPSARPHVTPSPRRYRPRVDLLEQRDCPSVVSPPGLTITATSPTQAKLAWTDQPAETGYRILNWDGAQISTLATLPANTTSYTANNLAPGSKPWFIVEAFDTTTYADTPWTAIQLPAQPITAPATLQGQALSQTQVQLTWGAATGETGYRVFEWNGTQAVQIASVSAATTTYTVSSLSPGTSYYFYVEAFNPSNAADTAWSLVRTQPTPVTAPTTFTISIASMTQLNLAWNGATGATGYHVYGWNGTNAVLLATLGATANSYAAKDLKAGTGYWFYVDAFNSNNDAYTAWKLGTTPSPTPLTAPSSITVQQESTTSVTVSWTASTGADGYRVLIYNGSVWSTAATVTADKSAATIKNLATGHPYWFLVEAFTANNGLTCDSPVVYIHL